MRFRFFTALAGIYSVVDSISLEEHMMDSQVAQCLAQLGENSNDIELQKCLDQQRAVNLQNLGNSQMLMSQEDEQADRDYNGVKYAECKMSDPTQKT